MIQIEILTSDDMFHFRIIEQIIPEWFYHQQGSGRYDWKWIAPNGVKIQSDAYPEWRESERQSTLFVQGVMTSKHDAIIVCKRDSFVKIGEALEQLNEVLRQRAPETLEEEFFNRNLCTT